MHSAAFQHPMSACDPVFVFVHPVKSQCQNPNFLIEAFKRAATFRFPPEMIKLPGGL